MCISLRRELLGSLGFKLIFNIVKIVIGGVYLEKLFFLGMRHLLLVGVINLFLASQLLALLPSLVSQFLLVPCIWLCYHMLSRPEIFRCFS